MKTIDLGRPVEVLRGMPVPTVGGKPMRFGDILVQTLQSDFGSHEHGVRAMRLAIDIERALDAGTIELEDDDFAFVRDVAKKDGRPAWAAWAVEQVFGT